LVYCADECIVQYVCMSRMLMIGCLGNYAGCMLN
jgi:hypothetical protein